jgi:hypothetical protein
VIQLERAYPNTQEGSLPLSTNVDNKLTKS